MSFVDLNHRLLQYICSHLIQASLTEVRKKIREIQGVCSNIQVNNSLESLQQRSQRNSKKKIREIQGVCSNIQVNNSLESLQQRSHFYIVVACSLQQGDKHNSHVI
jgi:hypothetical protein